MLLKSWNMTNHSPISYERLTDTTGYLRIFGFELNIYQTLLQNRIQIMHTLNKHIVEHQYITQWPLLTCLNEPTPTGRRATTFSNVSTLYYSVLSTRYGSFKIISGLLQRLHHSIVTANSVEMLFGPLLSTHRAEAYRGMFEIWFVKTHSFSLSRIPQKTLQKKSHGSENTIQQIVYIWNRIHLLQHDCLPVGNGS